MKNDIIIPDYLRPGDTIGLVCPAGYMPFEKTVACIDALHDWGFDIRIGDTVGKQHNYFSGTDEQRLHDVQAMIDDPNVKAVLAARGGFGSSLIIDEINWTALLDQPKWLIGFSDITIFNCHLYQALNMASMHAPMAGAFHQYGTDNDFVQSLHTAITGNYCCYEIAGDASNITGKASGPLLGGNLSLLAHITGTPSDINTEGCILFIEDLGEYYYNVDRMLTQLKRAGKLNSIAALIVGGFTDMKDTTIPLGKTLENIVLEKVSGYGYPVCFNFPVSHAKENYALKVGIEHKLTISASSVVLEEKVL